MESGNILLAPVGNQEVLKGESFGVSFTDAGKVQRGNGTPSWDLWKVPPRAGQDAGP